VAGWLSGWLLGWCCGGMHAENCVVLRVTARGNQTRRAARDPHFVGQKVGGWPGGGKWVVGGWAVLRVNRCCCFSLGFGVPSSMSRLSLALFSSFF